MSSAIASQLDEIASLPSTSKAAAYTSLLETILEDDDGNAQQQLFAFIEHVTAWDRSSISLVVSKHVVAAFVSKLAASPPPSSGLLAATQDNAEFRQAIAEKTLENCSQRQASFEDQIVTLRELLADSLEKNEEWTDAAKMLQGIPLESSNRTVPDEYKLKTYVRIVRLLLEDSDTVSAQSYLSRAQNLIRNTNDQETLLGFKLSQARIYDAQRKFAEASSKYHEISYVPEIDEGERLQMLSAAVTCAILSPAGPRRSRLLATLYRDERSSQLPQHSVLSAMFLDRIIRQKEVQAFSEMLEEHQKAKLASGSGAGGATGRVLDEDDEHDMETEGEGGVETDASERGQPKKGPEDVLDKAIMEHNLLCASLIYANITFSGLGKLLNLTPSSAEAMARTMIIQGRLKGATLDQVDRLITFSHSDKDEQTESGSSNVAAAAALAGDEAGTGEEEIPISVLAPHIARWDDRIRRQAQLTEDLAVRCGSLMAATAA